MNQQENPSLYDFELSGRDGIYHASWPNLHVVAKVTQVKPSLDHEVKAMLKFTSKRPTSAGHLRFGRVNITSPTARASFAKRIETREPEVDWDQILEVLCINVLDRYWSGSKEQELDGNVGTVEVYAKWLIDPLVQLNNPTLIYGPGSSGKSWLAQYISVLADSGISSGGFNVEPSKVLYLDWETDQQELQSRVSMIRRGLGITDPCHIWYKSMASGLSADLETVKAIVVDKSISLVVVDSIGSACMGEPESAEVVLRMFSALRSLGVSSICIDHTNKEKSLFGSVYKFNSARQIFEVAKTQKPEENKLIFGLFHRKANNSKLIKDMGFTLSFSEGSVEFSRTDIRDTPLEEHMRNADRIANALRGGGLTVGELAERLDKTENHIRSLLSQYSDMFVKLGKNQDGYDRFGNRIPDFEPITYEGGETGWPLNPES